MAVDPTRIPQLFFLSVNDVGGTKDTGAVFGAFYIKNTGADPCWITYTAVVPVASDGDGRTQIAAGSALNIDDMAAQFVSARCAAGKTAALQIVVFKRPGNSGTGEA